MARIGWTIDPVTVANTNRDGTGTLYRVFRVDVAGGQYIDRVICNSFGTNAQTEGVLIGSNGGSITDANNNFLMGIKSLTATTAGSPLTTDIVTFTIDAWLDYRFEIWALVNATQAAGRQYVAYADSSYQLY